MTPEQAELNRKIEALHAEFNEREEADKARRRGEASFAGPLTHDELVAHVESLRASVAEMRKHVDVLLHVVSLHFGRHVSEALANPGLMK